MTSWRRSPSSTGSSWTPTGEGTSRHRRRVVARSRIGARDAGGDHCLSQTQSASETESLAKTKSPLHFCTSPRTRPDRRDRRNARVCRAIAFSGLFRKRESLRGFPRRVSRWSSIKRQRHVEAGVDPWMVDFWRHGGRGAASTTLHRARRPKPSRNAAEKRSFDPHFPRKRFFVFVSRNRERKTARFRVVSLFARDSLAQQARDDVLVTHAPRAASHDGRPLG